MKPIIFYFTITGNTAYAAKEIEEVTGSKALRLQPAEPYSAKDVDWTDKSSRCSREHSDQSMLPEIVPVGSGLNDADTVFIGFPLWWGEPPAVIRSFLRDYEDQLKGKKLYPFCTSYETLMAGAMAYLLKHYPQFNWMSGMRLPASSDAITQWINQK